MSLPTISPDLDQLITYRKDCWEFARECVFTLDSVDKFQPVKPFPSNREYLRYVMNLMIEEPLLAIVKHRRMFMSWASRIVALWDAMFHEGRFIVILSKKEEDADDLVKGCKFIYDNIPPSKLTLKPEGFYKYTEFSFPEIDSMIKAFPQGADQLRQRTCSRIFADEMAFWPAARATFVSLKPTLEGGGKVCLLSTRYPGFFQELIEDRLDA